MKRIIILIIVLLLGILAAQVSFGQQAVTVVDMNGNVSTYSVRTYDLTPKTIPIKPYGLNLKPANVPERKYNGPVTFDAGRSSGGPVVIDNPYFPKEPSFPEQENRSFLESVLQAIGESFARTYSIL